MKQCLADQPWALRDKAVTTGEMPLLNLAIKGESLEAVRWILEQGANPNDGVDDQVLRHTWNAISENIPIRIAPAFVELIFECFRLLVSHGASVHEVARGKTLGMLNVLSQYRNTTLYDYTLDHINLLRSENYVDFDTCDEAGWSTLLIPIPALDSGEFNPVDLASYFERRRPTGVTDLLRSYARDEDIFYDAVERQDSTPVAA
ncbi:hypothetical protein GQX73_g9630 [Xylaria multiplex]|uniref:Uncharacterized protein n=1 Tax=Xylaria multiplex TaxID=323545 RepID=A0A7C8N135_9PEZI|nr:hypothetical protein GQX73_g9630 [Xylaria multiplex]